MKRIILFALAGLLLTSCGSQPKQSVVTKEQLTFPLGNPLPSPPFTGEAYIKQMIQLDEVFNFPATNNITFAPGAHSTWHRHGGMVVMVTGGVGLYQEEGKPAQILRQGDVLEIPAGVRHWHGAAPDNWFSQVVIYDTAWRPEAHVDEDNTLSDEDYAKVVMEEYPHQLPFPPSTVPSDWQTPWAHPMWPELPDCIMWSSSQACITPGIPMQAGRCSSLPTASVTTRLRGRRWKSCIPAMLLNALPA